MTVSKAVSVAVRGFHFYRNSWSHEASEIQECCECGNVFDIFAVKICLSNENTVGHLPRKVSRIIKYLIDRGDIVKSTLTTTDCRRFSLVRGWCGLRNHMQGFCENASHSKNHYSIYIYSWWRLFMINQKMKSFLPRPVEKSERILFQKRKQSQIGTLGACLV